jgi:hypothetical protein
MLSANLTSARLIWGLTRPMTRQQRIALAVILTNLALVLLFPPYDYVSLQRGNIPTFSGFLFLFGDHHGDVINQPYLTLEIIVVLINAAIAALLLQPKPVAKVTPKSGRYQRGVLLVVAFNLVMMLLFPPFENYAAVTKATLPTFEGFYFVFGDNSQRQIVTTILYIDIALVLINGALLWLMFRDRSEPEKLTPQEIRALAKRAREEKKKA